MDNKLKAILAKHLSEEDRQKLMHMKACHFGEIGFKGKETRKREPSAYNQFISQ